MALARFPALRRLLPPTLALSLAAISAGPAGGSMQANPDSPVSGGSLTLPPTDNCFGENETRYNLSSQCDPSEHANAELVLNSMRSYFELLGGKDSEEVRMFDELRARNLLRFYPPGQMPNGDIGNFVPGLPHGLIRLNSNWLARLAENSRQMPALELYGDLAGTIFHENVHRTQNPLRYAHDYYSETQAWEQTINRMARWIDGQISNLDKITDPVAFESERKVIDGLFGAWIAKTGPELFNMVNTQQINRLNFVGPCGISGSIIGDANRNVARNAIKACRERIRRRPAPGTVAAVQSVPEQQRKPLVELVQWAMGPIPLAKIVETDLPSVCNTRMGISGDLIKTSGRTDLAKYPFSKVESATLSGGICQMRVRLLPAIGEGPAISCTVKAISWVADNLVAVGESDQGGGCQ